RKYRIFSPSFMTGATIPNRDIYIAICDLCQEIYISTNSRSYGVVFSNERLDGCGLRGFLHAHPLPLPSSSGFCSSARAFAPRFFQNPASRRSPCASLSLHFHQAVKRTFTSRLSNMLGTQKCPRLRNAVGSTAMPTFCTAGKKLTDDVRCACRDRSGATCGFAGG